MKGLRPKSWNEFHHYKRRHPPWVKLHKRLLDDFEFQSLPLAGKALAPMLWLLASEDRQGGIDAEAAKISFRLRISEEELEQAIQPLINGGFFEFEEGASAVLALDMRDALRKSKSETEKLSVLPSGETDLRDQDFNLLQGIPNRRLHVEETSVRAMERFRSAARAAIPAFKDYCRKHHTYRPVHAERFLSQKRFEGFAQGQALSASEIEGNKDRADQLMRRGKYVVSYQ